MPLFFRAASFLLATAAALLSTRSKTSMVLRDLTNDSHATSHINRPLKPQPEGRRRGGAAAVPSVFARSLVTRSRHKIARPSCQSSWRPPLALACELAGTSVFACTLAASFSLALLIAACA